MRKPYLAYVKPEFLTTENEVLSFLREAEKETDPAFANHAATVASQAGEMIDRKLLKDENSRYSATKLTEM